MPNTNRFFSKRSDYISRINWNLKETLVNRLTCLADSWGSKHYGFNVADCCLNENGYPRNGTSVNFEFTVKNPELMGTESLKETKKKHSTSSANSPSLHNINIENVDKIPKQPGEIMEEILQSFPVPKESQVSWIQLFFRNNFNISMMIYGQD